MEIAGKEEKTPLKKFLLRTVLGNSVLTGCFVAALLTCNMRYTSGTATRETFLLNLVSLLMCSVHTVLVLIFSLRRFAKKETLNGIILLAYFFLSSAIVYFLFFLLSFFGFFFSMKGH
ncbi:MAG TPA: hypothetical protein VFU15_17355 [Bacteroidia bacterium]|nr:hypothetical protein [Bacteroidia bacterium]